MLNESTQYIVSLTFCCNKNIQTASKAFCYLRVCINFHCFLKSYFYINLKPYGSSNHVWYTMHLGVHIRAFVSPSKWMRPICQCDDRHRCERSDHVKNRLTVLSCIMLFNIDYPALFVFMPISLLDEFRRSVHLNTLSGYITGNYQLLRKSPTTNHNLILINGHWKQYTRSIVAWKFTCSLWSPHGCEMCSRRIGCGRT